MINNEIRLINTWTNNRTFTVDIPFKNNLNLNDDVFIVKSKCELPK